MEVKMIENCKEVLSSGFNGNWSQFFDACPEGASFVGGAVAGAIVALGIIVILLALTAVYIYTSVAWYKIGKKLKYKHCWIAWIPIVRIAMVLSLGRFHWALVFLILVPVLGWIALFVLVIISLWRIFARTGQPGWFSLSLIIPQIGIILYFIAIGLSAWSGKKIKK
jgi:hypothetical protein